MAFTDAFLTIHEHYGHRPVDADAYVAGWARAVEPLGYADAPTTAAGLRAAMRARQGELRVDDTTRRVVRFIRRIPFPLAARPVYWWLFQAAVASLPDDYRRMLGLRSLPQWFVRPVVRGMLASMRWALGDRSPMENAALQRRALLAGR